MISPLVCPRAGKPVASAELPGSWACRNLCDVCRGEICDLIEAHGHDPCSTASVAYDVLDTPLLRLVLYEKDEEGRIKARRVGEDMVPMTHTVEVALRTPLPSWWKPNISDT